jgi:uncharacterized protein
MTGNPVCWFEIYVQDMARAKAFYETVFEVKLQPLGGPGMEMWAFPATPDGAGTGGALVRMAGVPSHGPGTLVYFSCPDCGAVGARVAATGGRVEREKMSIGEYGFIVLARDTEGNMIGLHSLK